MDKFLIQSEPCASEAVRSQRRRAGCMPRNTGPLELQFGKSLKDHTDTRWKVQSAKLCSGVDQQCQMEAGQCSGMTHCSNGTQGRLGSRSFSLLRRGHQVNLLCGLCKLLDKPEEDKSQRGWY